MPHIVLAILFIFKADGSPADVPHIIGITEDMATCVRVAPKAMLAGLPGLPKDQSAAIKCFDVSATPTAASGKGQADTL